MKILIATIVLFPLQLFAGELSHWVGTWKADEKAIISQIHGISQDGIIVIPEERIPTAFRIEETTEGLRVFLQHEGGEFEPTLLVAGKNEILISWKNIEEQEKFDDSSASSYQFEQIFRIAYRRLVLECINITDDKNYRFTASRT